MGKKLVWYESYKTVCKYSAELTDEEAKLFEEDEEKFYEEVDFRGDQELEWDKIENEDEYDFSIEEMQETNVLKLLFLARKYLLCLMI